METISKTSFYDKNKYAIRNGAEVVFWIGLFVSFIVMTK